MKKVLIVFIVAAITLTCSIAALAVKEDYMPSVTAKEAPEVRPLDEDDSYVIGYSSTDGEVVKVPEGYLIVTAYADKDDAEANTDAKASLNAAMDDIVKAKDLGTLVKGLTDIAKEIDSDYTSRNFVVSQLFDARVIGSYASQIADSGVAYIKISFADADMSAGDDAPVILIRDDAGGKDAWSVIDDEDITVGNGYLILKLTKLGAFAFLSVVDVPLNPGTFDSLHIVAGIAAVCAVICGVALLIAKKKSFQA